MRVGTPKISKSAHLNAVPSMIGWHTTSTPTKNASLKTLCINAASSMNLVTGASNASLKTLPLMQVQHDNSYMYRPLIITSYLLDSSPPFGRRAVEECIEQSHHHRQQHPPHPTSITHNYKSEPQGEVVIIRRWW